MSSEPSSGRGVSARLWEVDALRGTVVVAMILYHVGWMLRWFGYYDVYARELWFVEGWQIGGSFLFIAGLSLHLQRARWKPERPWADYRRRYFLRAGWIILLALAVTVSTRVAMPEGYVVFGILHAIGFSILLAYPLVNRPWASLALGSAVVVAGNYAMQHYVAVPWGIPFGVRQYDRLMVDYFPFLPWYGVVLWGIAAGALLYRDGVRRFPVPEQPQGGFWRPVAQASVWLGRHSLLIYLVHLPVLYGLSLVLYWLAPPASR